MKRFAEYVEMKESFYGWGKPKHPQASGAINQADQPTVKTPGKTPVAIAQWNKADAKTKQNIINDVQQLTWFKEQLTTYLTGTEDRKHKGVRDKGYFSDTPKQGQDFEQNIIMAIDSLGRAMTLLSSKDRMWQEPATTW